MNPHFLHRHHKSENLVLPTCPVDVKASEDWLPAQTFLMNIPCKASTTLGLYTLFVSPWPSLPKRGGNTDRSTHKLHNRKWSERIIFVFQKMSEYSFKILMLQQYNVYKAYFISVALVTDFIKYLWYYT